MAVRCQYKKEVPAPFLGVVFFPITPVHRQRRDLVSTFDHSDIRGLVTEGLVFVAELPRSQVGSSAVALFV
jgi:hypothetical protein